MKLLAKYLSFLKDRHLDEVALENLRMAQALDLPIMKFVEHLPEEALLAQTRQSLIGFTDSLINGTYIETQMASIRRWEEGHLDNAPEGMVITPKDLVLIFALQRKMLRKFLPVFTQDVTQSIAILDELDELQTQTQVAAVETLFRKQLNTEKELKASELQIERLVDDVKVYAIFMIDPAGKILGWNKGAELIKGYKAEEIVGKNVSVFYTPEDLAAGVPQNNLERAAKNGSFETEGWRIRKDGTKFWADIVITAIYDDEGKLTGFSKVTRDISEHKKAREELEVTRDRFFRMFNLSNIPTSISEFDSGRFMYINTAQANNLRLPPEEMIGKTSIELGIMTPEEREGLKARIRKSAGRRHTEELTHKDGQGNTVHTILYAEVIEMDGKEAMLTTNVNITDRKRAEAEVLEVNRFLSTILENLPNMVFVKDAKELRFMRFNKAGENLLGLSRDELLGKNDFDFFPAEQAKAFTAKDREVLASDTVVDIPEEAIETRSGQRWLHTRKISVRDAGGNPIYLLGISEDITERKIAAEEKQKTGEAIIQLNRELTQKMQQLDVVNKELEAFTYSVSHDLRAPLRAVNGYANMLEEDFGATFDEEGKRLLGVIRYNAQRMGQLIDDLLAFSRLGRKELESSPEDMNTLVEGVLIELNKSVKHNADIRVGKLHRASVDYGLVHQVFLNLISNAVKYSSKKEKPVVEIDSKEEGDEVIFSVRDNGAGFDMRYYDKLFGVFQRLHKMDEFEGTGVGLAIVQRIVSKHYGRVWAESEVGKGATFFVALPKI